MGTVDYFNRFICYFSLVLALLRSRGAKRLSRDRPPARRRNEGSSRTPSPGLAGCDQGRDALGASAAPADGSKLLRCQLSPYRPSPVPPGAQPVSAQPVPAPPAQECRSSGSGCSWSRRPSPSPKTASRRVRGAAPPGFPRRLDHGEEASIAEHLDELRPTAPSIVIGAVSNRDGQRIAALRSTTRLINLAASGNLRRRRSGT